MTSLLLAAALAGQLPTPQLPAAAVPPPPTVAAAAAPAPAVFPLASVQSPPAASPVLLAVPQAAPAIPAYTVLINGTYQPTAYAMQQAAAASPYVNPFVVQPAPQPQQGIGAGLLLAGTVLVDNPWIFDRIAGSIGNCLAKRGHPKILIAPPGSQPPTPAGSSAAPVYLALPSGAAVQAVPYRHSRTAAGRWFFGE